MRHRVRVRVRVRVRARQAETSRRWSQVAAAAPRPHCVGVRVRHGVEGGEGGGPGRTG